MKKKTLNKYKDKWVLLDKKNNVIYTSDNIADVVEKGNQYPFGEVSISMIFDPDTIYIFYENNPSDYPYLER